MKTVAIVQARFSSQRLPGKAMMDLEGAPVLERVLRRLMLCSTLDQVVLATTNKKEEWPLIEIARNVGADVFVGSENDVLGRFVGASHQVHAETIVRITGDCPLLDPAVVDRVVKSLVPSVDYASNVVHRTFPRGLDVEVFFKDTLLRLDRFSQNPPLREHVTVLARGSEFFTTTSVEDELNNSDLRWTVDSSADLALVRRLYHDLGLGKTILPYQDMVAHVRRNPDLMEMNRDHETWSPDEEIILRPVMACDRFRLFGWANDPEVRAASFSSQSISWEEHSKWFDKALKDPTQLLFIGMNLTGQILGMVRFALHPKEAVVSILVSPEFRGRGYGDGLLRSGEIMVAQKEVHNLVAYTKPNNVRSMSCFRKAGYDRCNDSVMNGQVAVKWEKVV